MGWTVVLCASVASACLTLAAMHFVIWLKHRAGYANLAFVVLALGVGAFAWANLAMMRADTPATFARALWWTNWTIFVMVASIVAFIRLYFRTGRPWLGHLAWTTRLIALVVNLVRTPSFGYDEITRMRPVVLLGDRVYVPEGTTSLWHWFGQASFALLLWFVIDATYALWRAGNAQERQRALIIGAPTAAFVLAGGGEAALIFSHTVDWPHLEFIAFAGVLAAMAYELSGDVLRAARLAGDLQVSEAALRESEGRMRMAADEARTLGGRLINAQEDERRRIARDLHDDLNQQLALLALELELAARNQPEATRPQVVQLASKVRGLASQVHRLAYQLHPATLDQLGLETAARRWCREVTEQSNVQVEFVASGRCADVPADVALCVYRIMQEALRNVVRHSGAGAARVDMTCADGRLDLVVTDTGSGFDIDTATSASGLGLLSMRERAQLVHGTLVVESHRGAGTRVAAAVPLPDRGADADPHAAAEWNAVAGGVR